MLASWIKSTGSSQTDQQLDFRSQNSVSTMAITEIEALQDLLTRCLISADFKIQKIFIFLNINLTYVPELGTSKTLMADF